MGNNPALTTLLGIGDALHLGSNGPTLDLPDPGLLLPESLRAYGPAERDGLLVYRDQGNPEPSETYLKALKQQLPSWDCWVAEFPRSTWLPLGLVAEWDLGPGYWGMILEPASIPGLVPLMESVGGPLEGEVIGWQAWPSFQAVQCFAVPRTWALEALNQPNQSFLLSSSVLWTAYWQQQILPSSGSTRRIALVPGARDVSLWVMDAHTLHHHGRYLVTNPMDTWYHVLRLQDAYQAPVLHHVGPGPEDPTTRAALDQAFEQIIPLTIEGLSPQQASLWALAEGLQLWRTACG